ncbi:MAG: hypothetical protein CL946_06520 [Ectothiorhodospiraceae bacterium]|nr:hypothetical protein [Ectothiorhodospiraceae bacterium]
MKQLLYLSLIVLIAVGCADEPAHDTPSPNVISTATPEASKAGEEMYALGGNAMDAAVAAAFALAVTEPAGSGIGGQSILIVQRPNEDALVIECTSFAPAAADSTYDSWEQLTPRQRTTVPTTVKVLAYAFERYGSGNVSWEQVLMPAIRAAEEGFELGRFRRHALTESVEELANDTPSREVFLPGGNAPALFERIRQPMLAASLRRLAENGAEDFYSGSIAKEIVADMQQHGGWVTANDLSAVPEPREVPAITAGYRDLKISTTPPPYGGWAVLQALKNIERIIPEPSAPGQREYLLSRLRGLHLAHYARDRYPITDFHNYDEQVAERIRDAYSTQLKEEAGRGETTHLSAADESGMVVGISQSVNYYFGAKAMHPTLGFYYNDYMREFVYGSPEHPYAMKPGAMPYSSMSPTIAAKDGRPVAVLGSPGSARIISAVVQVLTNWYDLGMDIRDAVSRRRMHVLPDSTVYIEDPDQRQALREPLRQRGFRLETLQHQADAKHYDPYFGGVHAIVWDETGWRGAADNRRDGMAIGYP